MTGEGNRTRLEYVSEFLGGGIGMKLLNPVLWLVHGSYCRSMIRRLKEQAERAAAR